MSLLGFGSTSYAGTQCSPLTSNSVFLLFFIGLFVWGWGVAVQNQFFGVDVSSLRVQLNENKIKFQITVRPVKLTTDNNVSLKREENGMGVFREVL